MSGADPECAPATAQQRYAACIEYCGLRYAGWQRQKHASSVQETLEKAISRVANHAVGVVAAGRTDSGVHGCGQVVHFDTTSDGVIKHLDTQALNVVGNVVGGQDLVSLIIDNATLVVGHIIVFQQLLSHVEVATFHLALSTLDGIADHLVLDGLALLETQNAHHFLDTLGAKQTHQVIFQRQEKPG